MVKMQQQTDDILLRRYLLGEASLEEQSMVEQQLLSQENFFNQLLRVEEELTDQYVAGKLQASEKYHFESYFMKAPERRESVEFAKAFNRRLTENSKAQPGKRSFLAFVSQRRTIVQAGMVFALMLLAVVSLLLWRQNIRLKKEIQQAYSQPARSAHQDEDLKQQLNQAKARVDQLAANAQQQQDQLVKLEQELTRAQTPRVPRGIESTVAVLTLSPGISRSADTAGVANLSAATRQLRLQLKTNGSGHRTYRAEVQTVEGQVVWAHDGLSSRGNQIIITLPAGLITRSDYLVVLSGARANQEFEKIGAYYFGVIRKPI
jgi:murein DD-endopeptidase MepM/ murein hydrolase activator NlpD